MSLVLGWPAGRLRAPGSGQGSVAEKAEFAEQRFKNVRLLKGISVQEFMEMMGFFAASTNMTCVVCHGDESASGWGSTPMTPP